MAIYNKRIEFTTDQLINHSELRNSILSLIYGIIRFLFIILQNLYCVSSYLILSWIILLPLSWLKSDLYSAAENYLYNSLLYIVSSWSLAAGATIVEAGDEYKHLVEGPNDDFKPETAFKSRSREDLCIRHRTPNGVVDEYKPSSYELKSNRGSDFNEKIDSKSSTKQTSTEISSGGGERLDHDKPTADQDNEKHTVLKESCRLSNRTIKINNIDNNNFSDILCKNNRNSLSDSSSLMFNNHSSRYSNDDGTSNHQYNQVEINKRIVGGSINYRDANSLKVNSSKPRILLLCNHISTADVLLMMQSFSTLTNHSLLWVLDAQFKLTQFGVVCSSHGDFFVSKNTFTSGSLREQVLKHPDRNILVLFPEGGFLKKRIAGSNRYAARNNLPVTKYVTHPRFGAFKDLIDPSVGITHIVDATLMYNDIENPLSILDIALGNRKEPAVVYYKLYKRSDINPTEEWLRDIWLRKDKLLEEYYKDRSRVLKMMGKMRSSELDWFKILSVHLFYLLVCYLTIYRLFIATSMTMLKARELYYSTI